MIERKGLIVYFDDQNALSQLDKSIFNVYYVSKKENYAVIYFDANRYKQVIEIIGKIKGIVSFADCENEIGTFSFEK